MKRTKIRIQWHRSLTVTILVILMLSLATFLSVSRINKMEEEFCLDTLHEEAWELSRDIETHVRNDIIQLKVIANIIAGYDEVDSEEVRKLLNTYESQGMMSDLGVLLPDNSVLLSDGSKIEAGDKLSFETEAAQGVHISGREYSITEEDTLILRNYVPVVKDGETKAMLYGVVKLKDLPDLWKADAYDGNAAIYLIDGDTGDFLIDTWHKELGNIWDMGNRRMKTGYTREQLLNGVASGVTGHVVFVSRTLGEYLYFYFEPVEISNWRIALSVPESVVFQKAEKVRSILWMFTIFEAVCFLGYFVWVFAYLKQETREKQQRLDMISYIYDVEKILFTAHQKKENIEQALKKIADMTTAESVYFKIFQEEGKERVHIWSRKSEGKEELRTLLEENQFFMDYFSGDQESIMLYRDRELKQTEPEKYKMMEQNGLESLMLIQVKDIENHIVGILGADNMEHRWKNTELLKNVALSFSLLCHNMKSFAIIKEMGEKDILTGLLNRNSFENQLAKYRHRYQYSLACIYADANGLHELNNTKGHEAGDRMLQRVAEEMQNRFGEERTYRIGGDEFVAIVLDKEESEILQLTEEIKTALRAEGYHLSVGVQWKQSVASMDDLVKEAEQKMYAEKKRYYETIGKECRKSR